MRGLVCLLAASLVAMPAAAQQTKVEKLETKVEKLGADQGYVDTDVYPAESLQLREEGVVHYLVEIDRKGQLETCEVTKSSGYSRLDHATCVLLVRQARFRPQVNAEGRAIPAKLNGKIVWKLPS